MANFMDTSLVIPIPKKGNHNIWSNYITLSLISLLGKIILRLILNILKLRVETILADQQAGFRKNSSNAEQILNCRLLMDKHIKI